jgi:hypothetical protein
MSRADAYALANAYRIPLGLDFHALDTAQVENVIAAADSVKYRKPANANGSRARYFHARLVRAASKPRD